MYNNVYNTLNDICESIAQLAQEEDLNVEREKIPNVGSVKKYLEEHDDYFGQFSNGTWYHLQPHPIFV